MREDTERLLEVPYGLMIGRSHHSLLSCLPTIRPGLDPHLARQGMVRQAFDLLRHPVPCERLQGLDNAGMQHPPALLEQTAISHLVCEGVLEGVLGLWEEARLVQEFGGLEVCQATMQRRLG